MINIYIYIYIYIERERERKRERCKVIEIKENMEQVALKKPPKSKTKK